MRTALASLLVLFVVAASSFAQDPAAMTAAESACGPKEAKFDAKQDSSQHPAPPADSGKALIYIVQELGEFQCTGCALTKLGLDGAWVGANQGSSYFFFSADPGEHHLCLNWQSRLEGPLKSIFSGQLHRRSRKNLLLPRSHLFHSLRLLVRSRPDRR